MEDDFKIVNLSFTEKASVVVQASTDEEAEEAVETEFNTIPDLKIISIEQPDAETIQEIKAYRAEKAAANVKPDRTLN